MRSPCNSGETPSHMDMSASRLCMELRFLGNLQETCFCNIQMIMVQFSFERETLKNRYLGDYQKKTPTFEGKDIWP